MFDKIFRVIKSVINSLLNKFENPEVILQNNLVEMRESFAKLNDGMAKASSTVYMLKNEISTLESQEKDYLVKLKVAADNNEEEWGIDLAVKLQNIKNSKQKAMQTLVSAEKGLESLKQLKQFQTTKMKSEIEKIKVAINDARIAKIKGDIASLFEQFNVKDVAFTNEQMLNKLKEKSAYDESKLEIVNDSLDIKILKLENNIDRENARKLFEEVKKKVSKSKN